MNLRCLRNRNGDDLPMTSLERHEWPQNESRNRKHIYDSRRGRFISPMALNRKRVKPYEWFTKVE